ncbi:MAG: sugar ABC transporter permease [Thermoanaerobacterium sp.]|nr:sugar ABC transporter permease [Thermoanaerobacterium sp.]
MDFARGIKKRERISSFQRHQQNMAYVFIFLPMILFLIFVVIPSLMSLYLSFTDYNVIQTPKLIGIKNYITLLKDQFFWISLKNTFYYTALYVPLGIITALFSALLLNRKKIGIGIFRVSFYLPVLSSAVATATIWIWLLNPQYGIINTVLGWFGINGPAWLADTRWAMISIVVMSVWASFGSNMMIFLAGLQGIPDYLYESAKLDGANRWQLFWYITLPSLRSTTFFVTTMLFINAFQMFDQAFVMTQGGPGNTTLTLVYYIYNNGFGSLRMGYASALSFVLFLIILTVSLINMRFNSENVQF